MSDQREPVPDYVVEFLDAVERLVQATADQARQRRLRPAVELTGSMNIGVQIHGNLDVTPAEPQAHVVCATDSVLAVDDAGIEVITAAVSSIGAPLIEQVRTWLQTKAREHPFLFSELPNSLAATAVLETIADPEHAAEVVSVLLREIMGLATLVIYYLSR